MCYRIGVKVASATSYTVRRTVRVDRRSADELDRLAVELGRKVSELHREALHLLIRRYRDERDSA